MKIKKIFAGILAVCMIFIMTGCSSGEGIGESATDSAAVSSTKIEDPFFSDSSDSPILITKDYSLSLTETTVLPAGDPNGIEDSPTLTLRYFLINDSASSLDVSKTIASSVMVSYDKPDVIPLTSVTVLNPETEYYKRTIAPSESSFHNAVYKLENLTDPVTVRFHDGSDENFPIVGTTTIDISSLAENITPNSENPSPSAETSSSSLTLGQLNALETAGDYLDIMPFSYNGLVGQLEYEGYTHEEAVYAADHCGADWNEQAAKLAKSYLDTMTFSRQGLIEQLEYEGFTHDQAVYGVEQNGY